VILAIEHRRGLRHAADVADRVGVGERPPEAEEESAAGRRQDGGGHGKPPEANAAA
jgi:hypothetical protein